MLAEYEAGNIDNVITKSPNGINAVFGTRAIS